MKRGDVVHYTREQIMDNMRGLRDALMIQNPKSAAIEKINKKLDEMENDVSIYANGADGIW